MPVPHPNSDLDWLRTNLATTLNSLAWSQQPKLQEWLAGNRLNFGSHFAPKSNESGKELEKLAARTAKLTLPAITKLEELLALEE